MKISLIAAIGREREIGADGEIPWRGKVKGDLARFREVTDGHVVIMGRKTYESIGRPLPNRVNVVISRNSEFDAPGTIRADSLDQALGLIEEGKEVFIIGGGEIYAQAMRIANRMYLTFVDISVPNADAYFPSWDIGEWKVREVLPCPPKTEGQLNSTYVVYERRQK